MLSILNMCTSDQQYIANKKLKYFVMIKNEKILKCIDFTMNFQSCDTNQNLAKKS